jgi:hypothetical protein
LLENSGIDGGNLVSESTAIPDLGPRTLRSSVANPYAGPRPFTADEHRKFAGRDDEISELSSLIVSHQVVLLYAQSGAGKTSLLNAGLTPALKEKGVELLPTVRIGIPVSEAVPLEEVRNVYVFSAICDLLPDIPDEEISLRAATLKEALDRIPRRKDDFGDSVLRVIAFDQFEELFSIYPQRWQDRRGFFAQVAEALRGDGFLRVLFVLREDYWAAFREFAGDLPESARTQYHLERLREPEALLAITRPLEGTRWSFEEGVAQALVRDLMTISVESGSGESVGELGEFVESVQLQVVCFSLFERIPSTSTVITMDDLRAFGNPDRALQRFYENAIESASTMTRVDEGDLRTWFESHLITPAGTRGLVFRGLDSTGGIPNDVVDILEAQHLIRPEIRSGSRWYELTHDRFIRPIQRSNLEWKSERLSEAFEAHYMGAIQKAVFETGVSESTLRGFLDSLVTREGRRLSRAAGSIAEPPLAILRDAGLLREETRGNEHFYSPVHDGIAQGIQRANQNWQAKNWSRAHGLGKLEARARRWARTPPMKKPKLLTRTELHDAEDILRAAKVSGIGVQPSLKDFVQASRETERARSLRVIASIAPFVLAIVVIASVARPTKGQEWLFLAQYAGFGALGSCAQLAFSAWFVPNSLVPLLYLRGTILRLAWGMILGLVVAWVYSGREVNAKGIAIALATGAVSNVLADQLTRAVDAVRPSSLRETNERRI